MPKGQYVRGEAVEARFARYVSDEPGAGCREWLGTKTKQGYGMFGLGAGKEKRMHNAHRVAWMLEVGPIPEGKMVLHLCHNRACVNVAHLKLGTFKENSDDMVRAGRSRLCGFGSSGQPNCYSFKGEAHWKVKLKESDVAALRERHDASPMNTQERMVVALGYGVSLSTIDMLLTRKTWKHLP